MALAYTAVKTSRGSWIFTWDSTSNGSYQIWLDGEMIDTVETESSSDGTDTYECLREGYVDAPPPLEIIDDTETAESSLYPPYLIIQWRRVAAASNYRVDELVDSAWTERKWVRESGLEYYSYKTQALADVTEANWQVVALNEVGDEGTPVEFEVLVVKNPDPPEVVIDYESGGTITVTAEE